MDSRRQRHLRGAVTMSMLVVVGAALLFVVMGLAVVVLDAIGRHRVERQRLGSYTHRANVDTLWL